MVGSETLRTHRALTRQTGDSAESLRSPAKQRSPQGGLSPLNCEFSGKDHPAQEEGQVVCLV